MKVNKKELQQALTIVKPGLANKELLEQTTSFAFMDGRVLTYNDEVSVSHPVGEIDFEGAVKAEEIYGLLSKLKKEEVDFETTEDTLEITCGRVKAGLKLEREIRLPIKKIPKKWEVIPDPKKFKEFVGLAMRTCSTDMSRLKLTCVYIGESLVIGSDGHKLIKCKGLDLPVDSFLLPASSAVELLKTDPTHMTLEGAWAHFKNKDGTVFSCRLLEDDYVSMDSINSILRFTKLETFKFPDRILEMLGRVHQLAKCKFVLDEWIDITVEDGKIKLYARSEETNSWIEESATMKTLENFNFRISPSLFVTILGMTTMCTISDDKTRVQFTSKDWEYVVMLRGE